MGIHHLAKFFPLLLREVLGHAFAGPPRIAITHMSFARALQFMDDSSHGAADYQTFRVTKKASSI